MCIEVVTLCQLEDEDEMAGFLAALSLSVEQGVGKASQDFLDFGERGLLETTRLEVSPETFPINLA